MEEEGWGWAWARVVSGEAPLTWDLWAAWFDRATCLTAEGKQVAVSAVGTLRQFLGEDWPNESLHSEGSLVADLDLWLANNVPHAAVRFFSLYARIALLLSSRRVRTFRRALQRNKSNTNWSHSELQLEVAGFAHRAGRCVTFEPPVGGGRSADLHLNHADGHITVECVTHGTDDRSLVSDDFFDAVHTVLMEVQ